MTFPENDDESGEPLADTERESRTASRRKRKATEAALAQLAVDLCRLSERRLRGLALPEEVHDAVLSAQRIHSATAHNRALRFLRQQLRDQEWAALAERMGPEGQIRRAPGIHPDENRAEEWCERLAQGGDADIGALMKHCPDLQRSEVRVLVRNLKKAAPNEAKRARLLLKRIIAANWRVSE